MIYSFLLELMCFLCMPSDMVKLWVIPVCLAIITWNPHLSASCEVIYASDFEILALSAFRQKRVIKKRIASMRFLPQGVV